MLELPEDGRLDFSVLDASYALERVSGGVLKITRKKGDKETASFASLDVKGAVYQPLFGVRAFETESRCLLMDIG